mmetsp:Transcript_4976/g.12383  ORF Transcript_4976/g.12383 Transcript_4976/m.12383 type:complete len:355 (+) Transcript_4976:218-1282(+)
MGTWVDPFSENTAGNLVTSGEEEHYHIAKRMLARYQALLGQTYNPQRALIQTTQVSRAARSGNTFAFGLLEGRGTIGGPSVNFEPWFQYSESMDSDFTLRFFSTCPNYIDHIKNNASSYEVQSTIWAAKHYPQIAQSISELIGVAPTWNISVDQVSTMFSLCGFEIAVFNRTDRFCSLFDEDATLTLEYGNDLVNYWEKGYGHTLNYHIAVPLLRDIVNRTDFVISEQDRRRDAPRTSFSTVLKYRFAHAETMMPLQAILGLYKDSYVLRADLDPALIAKRKWRTSIVSPFATNLLFNLYHCAESDQFLIQGLHDEREIIFPGCGGVYCPYEQFKQSYAEPLAYNFAELCFVKE